MPFIRSEEIEKLVWTEVMMTFTYITMTKEQREKADLRKQRILIDVFSLQKYKEQISTLQKSYDQWEKQLRGYQTSLNNWRKMMRPPNCDIERINKEIISENEKEHDCQNNMETIQGKITELENANKDQEKLLDFITKNQNVFRNMRKDIDKLVPSDRKRLIESMLTDNNIIVNHEPQSIDSGGGIQLAMKLHIHVSMLQTLANEGKLTLNKESQYHSSSSSRSVSCSLPSALIRGSPGWM